MDFLKNNARYIIGFLVTSFLLVVLVVLLLGGGSSNNPAGNSTDKTTTKKVLQDYSSTNTVVRLTIDGPVTAQQVHTQTVITVGRDNTVFSLNEGYDGKVAKTQSYANTETSYNVFLNSLNKAGFDKGDPSKNLQNARGYCPTSNRYIFEVIENGNTIQRYWTTNCGSTPKTYLGSLGLTLTLFRSQVPDYNTLTADARTY